jgi:hypothetical protein
MYYVYIKVPHPPCLNWLRYAINKKKQKKTYPYHPEKTSLPRSLPAEADGYQESEDRIQPVLTYYMQNKTNRPPIN